ncbi:MAG: hypothetical protein JHC74_09155 [Thermoleophilia bacterium]|nr:hypothetical protein [Thermoleophilia bacterium]
MTTATRHPGTAIRRPVLHEPARAPGEAAPAARGHAPPVDAVGDEPPALVFFDGLADARELAAWGAWRRDRD